MREIRTSGSMSGDGKRSVAAWPKLPRPSSTLPDNGRRGKCQKLPRAEVQEEEPRIARLQLACEPATIFLHATAIWRDAFSGDGRLAATGRNRHPRGGLALQHRRRFFRHHALRFQHGSRSTHGELGSTQANDHPRLETEAGEIKCKADRQVVLAC